MNWFLSGKITGLICFIFWIFFDQLCLNKWQITSSCNKWLKQSLRRSIILDICIATGFILILSRVLDLMNTLIGTFIMLFLVSTYNTCIVLKNKTIGKIT